MEFKARSESQVVEASQEGAPSGKIPVTLLTGFLGSGKTTLLNNLVKDAEMADTAVIINEFGDVPLDHLIVESSIENAVVLQSGCICCTVRGDLVDTLTDLLGKAERGDIPKFTRIAIETTGLADPSSIGQSIATEALIREDFMLEAVVTTIDAVNGSDQLDEFPEASRQVAMADLMILTKTDIADAGAPEALEKRLTRLNPGVEIVTVVDGKLSAKDLFRQTPSRPADGGSVRGWMKAEVFEAEETEARTSAHDAAIGSFVIRIEEEIEEEALRFWLTSIASLRGPDLMRMKGIVAVKGLPGPVVIHAVQHLVHEPVRLESWPDQDHTTRIVFITRNIPAEALRESFYAICSPDRAAQTAT